MDKEETLENCPHCGTRLSPWQKVLLNVDKAIVCKKCWYRILLKPKAFDSSNNTDEKKEKKEKRRSDGNV